MLEWCKLLGDEKDKHFWRNVVTDPAAFEASLLVHLEMTASDFVDLAKKMRRYRDKFVAHLDSDPKMYIPRLTPALSANSFYHGHIVRVEAAAGDLFGLADTSDSSRKAMSNASRKPSGPMIKLLRAAMARIINVRQRSRTRGRRCWPRARRLVGKGLEAMEAEILGA